jgi:TIR domain
LTALDSLMHAAKPIVPVATGSGSFTQQMPAQLHLINGFTLNDPKVTFDRVVNTVLEALQLLRRRRRLFISYARKDSTGVAKQLFGSLAESGFDVFLDTHSVPAAVNFQDQLWHSMVDSDLVLLLDTNGFDDSRWCRAEFERADALSIGVIRVIWPDRAIDANTDPLLLSLQMRLARDDFESGASAPSRDDRLCDAAIVRIVEAIEGFRARAIAARQANLVTSFKREAQLQSIHTLIQPNLHIVIEKLDGAGGKRKIAVVPTVGVPVSTNYHDAFIEYQLDSPDIEAQVVLYDRQGFLPSWVDHLTWLNARLPVQGLDVTDDVAPLN